MSESKLVLHCGAREVPLEELHSIPCPQPTETWFPVSHGDVIDTVGKALTDGGFQIEKAQYALTRHDARMFATLDLTAAVGNGCHLSVGIRNSVDKSMPLGWCAGSRVFVCDNLSFRSELLVKRKHSRFGQLRFSEAICAAVQGLEAFREVEKTRIKQFQHTVFTADQKDSLILRAFEQSVISSRHLLAVIRQVRAPDADYGNPDSAWSVFNAITWVMADIRKGNPQRFAHLTMRLNGLFDTHLEIVNAA